MNRETTFFHPEFDRVAERLNGFAWGAAAGQPAQPSLTSWCRSVASADEARRLLESDAWEAWSSETHGTLADHLDRRCHQRYQDWRRISGKAKELLARHEPAIAQGLKSAGLDGEIPLDTVRWDVVAALVCAGFMDCGPPTDTLKLLDVYEAGHLPVGWDGAQARVLVF